MKKPNILFFFSDQQRADTCGCYGQKLATTPELDAMAKEGVRFSHAFTAQPVCGPTRAILQTGLYATEVGCHRNDKALNPNQPTIAKQLKSAGYQAGYIGKWHLASQSPDFNYRTESVPPELRGGYDDYWLASDALEFTSHGHDGHMFDGEGNKREFPEGRFRADAQTDFVLEYLDQQNENQPFFLFTSYLEPHHQNDHNRYEGPHGSKEQWANYETPGDLEGTIGDWRENYPDYLGCINALDQGLARVRQKLKEKGLLENTVIIFTSDHGSHFRTRNGEYKRSCHDASLHVPLVISGPGFSGGKVKDELISLVDLPKTILKIAGAEEVPAMQGHDLRALVSGENKSWSDDHFFQISESGIGRGIRTHRWKYSVEAKSQDRDQSYAEAYEEAYLYDLESDPHERENLVDHPELESVRNDLKERLFKRMAIANEDRPKIVPKGSLTTSC